MDLKELSTESLWQLWAHHSDICGKISRELKLRDRMPVNAKRKKHLYRVK